MCAILQPFGAFFHCWHQEWLHILEMTGQVIIVPPYFENFGKRLIKSAKVYWADSGMACFLLGIESQSELERSSFWGPLFEGFVVAEILKSQVNKGDRKELYAPERGTLAG